MIFNLGWVFYHYTGIMVVDFPMLALIILGHTSKGKFRYYFPGISTPAIILLVWGVITSLIALEVGWALAELSMILRAYLVFISVANNIKHVDDIKAMLKGFAAGVALEFFMAMWQWRLGPTPLLPFINEQFHEWRATGTFYMPHYLANYLLVLMPILFRFLLYFKPPKKIMTTRYGILFSVSLLTFLITFARGSWIAFAVSMSLVTVWSVINSKYRVRVKWALGLLVLGAGLLVVRYSDTIINQFGKERSDATSIRFDQIRTAKRLIKDNWLVGTGLGNYELISPNYVYDYERADPRSWQFSEMVHNSYLFFTSQLGIPGLLILIWGGYVCFKYGIKVVKSKISFFSNLGIAINTGFVGIAVAFIAGPDIKSAQLLIHIGMNVGLLIGMIAMEKNIKKYFCEASKTSTPEELRTMMKKMDSMFAI
ncbi:O-antigen ligase family protein [candidate division KSB1 bacterium]|nr:O-antigen ligase family protein [candidate division KSB1 bacterium]